MKKLITLLLVITAFGAFSQRRTCTTMDKLHQRMAADPEFAARNQEMMDFIYSPNNPQTLFRNPDAPSIVVTIPVVFHVLYKNASQNISDAQINSQLDALNRDYRKLNADFNTVVPAAFETAAKIAKGKGDGSAPERQVRIACRDLFRRSGILDKIVPMIEEVLRASGIDPPADAPEAVEPAIPKEESSGDDGHRG